MTKNSLDWSLRLGIQITAVVLAIAAIGCRRPDVNDEFGSGAGGQSTTTPGDTTGSGIWRGPTDKCPATANPPMSADTRFCENLGCPSVATISDIPKENLPMGDCCNTVDINLKEANLKQGNKYDLGFAAMRNLSDIVVNPGIITIQEGYQNLAEDMVLIRYNQVPRTEDMTGPVQVNFDMGSGKENCDGTFSFYGEGSAPLPLEQEKDIGDHPDRWAKKNLTTMYNGFKAPILADKIPEDDVVRINGLVWQPRWLPGGLNYEQPAAFVNITLVNDLSVAAGDANYSCFGSMDNTGKWTRTLKLTLFIPLKEAEIAVIPALSQSLCGVLANGPVTGGGGNCNDKPQDQWQNQPGGYCDGDYRCWIGDKNNSEYADFWSNYYKSEGGCGKTYKCCDPTGKDSSLEKCNAFYIRNSVTLAAVTITPDDITNPADAISSIDNCK
jgi:hypothetical protein